MKNHIITISREFGSGGRTIGKKAADQLGIPCYDADLIHKIAQESGFTEGYIREAGEYAPSGFLSSAFADRFFGPTNEDYLWNIQYQIITELAEKGAMCHCRQMCGLHFAGQGRLLQGIYPCRYEISRGTHRERIR